MLKYLTNLAMLSTLIVFGGCSSKVEGPKVEALDYGFLPENYKEIIKVSVGKKLSSEYSSAFVFKEPFKGAIHPIDSDNISGWIVCGSVSPDTSKMARPFFSIVKNNRVIALSLGSEEKDIQSAAIEDVCKGEGYGK